MRRLLVAGLVGEHGAIADFVPLHFFDGLVGLGHRDSFGRRVDAVARGYVEHFFQAAGAARGVTADGAHPGNERESVPYAPTPAS